MQIKYFTLAAVCEPTDTNPFGSRYMGTLDTQDRAVETAQSLAVRLDAPVDVTACCVNPDDNRITRYFPDGSQKAI